jgi:hypothetical protein
MPLGAMVCLPPPSLGFAPETARTMAKTMPNRADEHFILSYSPRRVDEPSTFHLLWTTALALAVVVASFAMVRDEFRARRYGNAPGCSLSVEHLLKH